MVLFELKNKFAANSTKFLIVMIAVFFFMLLKVLAHGESRHSETEKQVIPEIVRNADRRILDMNSCTSCHTETYSIGQILDMSRSEDHEWKCRGPVGEVVERNRHLRGAIKRVDKISESVFGNYYKSFQDGTVQYGNSSESEIMQSIFGKISELKDKHENYLQQQVEDVKKGEKECGVIEDEAVAIYGSVNEVFMQRRLRNILFTVTIACFVFIFSVIIGYRKMLPSVERRDNGEKGDKDGD